MFARLRKKWKVSGLQFALIIAAFAIAGSLTGYAGKKIMNLLEIEKDWLWISAYILLVAMIWPFAVIIVSIPLGQYRFFARYVRKMGEKVGFVRKMKKS